MKLSEILDELDLIDKKAECIKPLIKTEYWTAIEVNLDQIQQAVRRIKGQIEKV